MNNSVFVLVWYYGDKSDFGVVATYQRRSEAERTLKLLQEHQAPRCYTIVESELYN